MATRADLLNLLANGGVPTPIASAVLAVAKAHGSDPGRTAANYLVMRRAAAQTDFPQETR